MATRNTGLGWSRLELLGIVAVALGAAFLAYSAYNFVSTPAYSALTFPTTHAGNFTGTPGGAAGNFTGFNRSRVGRNFTTAGAGFSTSDFEAAGTPLVLRVGDMLSGVLTILLGVVIFKYGGLRKHVKPS